MTGADIVPYRGRLALRIARLVLALACLMCYGVAGAHLIYVLAALAAYAMYSVAALFELRFDKPARSSIALIADTIFFGFWTWIAASGPTGGAAAGMISALLCGYLLASALLHRRYLEGRMSNILRYNLMIRSQAQGAREAERQRIAADFHDGPLQSFISFQMRLEVLRKILQRDVGAATEELRQLQQLCRDQVTELRTFVRNMRPVDDGSSLPASLSRMVEQFGRDTGISATFSSGELHDPEETEVSLELLQIVREALNNIQKHSGATRIAVSMGVQDGHIHISAEDNGGGFSFSGSFNLNELELLRLGPVSIKRRVRMLDGELQIDSRPGEGAQLQIRIPCER